LANINRVSFFSPLNSAINFPQSTYYTAHYTLNVLLQYLVNSKLLVLLSLLDKMVFTTDDRILIKKLYLLKSYGITIRHYLLKFRRKTGKKVGHKKLLRKIHETGGCDRRHGSSRSKSARTVDNVTQVEELVFNRENKPQTQHDKFLENVDFSQSSVVRIIHRDLALRCYKNGVHKS